MITNSPPSAVWPTFTSTRLSFTATWLPFIPTTTCCATATNTSSRSTPASSSPLPESSQGSPATAVGPLPLRRTLPQSVQLASSSQLTGAATSTPSRALWTSYPPTRPGASPFSSGMATTKRSSSSATRPISPSGARMGQGAGGLWQQQRIQRAHARTIPPLRLFRL